MYEGSNKQFPSFLICIFIFADNNIFSVCNDVLMCAIGVSVSRYSRAMFVVCSCVFK